MTCRSASMVNSNCKAQYPMRSLARGTSVEERARLYLLSFLLTGDRDKAERCFVAGLDVEPEDNTAFREWLHSWARRIVIQNALHLVSPHPEIPEINKFSMASRQCTPSLLMDHALRR